MLTTRFRSFQIWFPIILALTGAIVGFRLWQINPDVTDENHLIENCQAILLIGAVGLHFLRGAAAGHLLDRWGYWILACLCLSVLIREVDIDRLGTGSWWIILEIFVRTCIGLLWLGMLWRGVKLRSQIWRHRRRCVASKPVVLATIGVAFYMASWFFDKGIIPMSASPSQLVEELLQLSGTVFFFTSGGLPMRFGPRCLEGIQKLPGGDFDESAQRAE